MYDFREKGRVERKITKSLAPTIYVCLRQMYGRVSTTLTVTLPERLQARPPLSVGMPAHGTCAVGFSTKFICVRMCGTPPAHASRQDARCKFLVRFQRTQGTSDELGRRFMQLVFLSLTRGCDRRENQSICRTRSLEKESHTHSAISFVPGPFESPTSVENA